MYSSRQTNSAGGVKELYYSNGGMIDMDKQTVTPTGGLTAKSAAEMKMQPNLLPSFSLSEEVEETSTAANTEGRSADLGQHAQLDGVRALAQDAECQHRRRLQPLRRAVHERSRRCRPGQKVTFDDKTQQVMVWRQGVMHKLMLAGVVAASVVSGVAGGQAPQHGVCRWSPMRHIGASTSRSMASPSPHTCGRLRSRSLYSIR